jgi:hypothetical protein
VDGLTVSGQCVWQRDVQRDVQRDGAVRERGESGGEAEQDEARGKGGEGGEAGGDDREEEEVSQ